MTELITTINPQEFGLTTEVADNIIKDLPQILSEREVLKVQYNEIVLLDINDPKTSKAAAELRKLVKNNRTKGIENWHNVNKEYFLRGGQFIDAIKRKEVAENKRMEDALEQIEKHFENLEKQRIADLDQERKSKLAPYVEDVIALNLGEMQEDVWDAYFSSKVKSYNDRIEAERKAEEERIAKEKAEAEERERIRIENERLKKEAEEREALLKAEREKAEKERLEVEKRIQAEREKVEAEERKKAEILAKQQAEEKAKQDAILKAEQEAKAKLEAELKAKRDAELKAEEERKAAELKAQKEAEKLAKAPIKKQLTSWVDTFSISEFNGDSQLAKDIQSKFESFKTWAKSEIDKL